MGRFAAALSAEDPLAAKAHYYRGVCLFQLKQYAAAEAQFVDLTQRRPELPELLEETYANLGLARYNRAQAANSDFGKPGCRKSTRKQSKASRNSWKNFPMAPWHHKPASIGPKPFYALDQLAEAAASRTNHF